MDVLETVLITRKNGRRWEQILLKVTVFLELSVIVPITDLDHADFAYEWMFEGQIHYMGMPFVGFNEGNLSPFAQSLSWKMGEKYVEYFNTLELKNPDTGEMLKISKDHGGNGSAYLKKQLEKAADKYVAKFPERKQELEHYSWLHFREGKATFLLLRKWNRITTSA